MTKYNEATKVKYNYCVNETEVSIRREGAVLKLSFKGSTGKWNSPDWLANYAFPKKKLPYRDMEIPFKAHGGFVDKYKSVRERILQEAQNPEVEYVIVYGFSQGAALGLLCYEDLQFHAIPSGAYLFGCPRVFGWRGKDHLDAILGGVTRYESKGDVVTHLPLALMGFKHYGKGRKLPALYKWWQFKKNHMSYGEYDI